MPRYRWIEPDPQPGGEDLSSFGLIGDILAARGIRSIKDAVNYLDHSLETIPDPESLPDISTAADLIQRAVREQARIAVFGDYDVDGVTSTALMADALVQLGAEVCTYLPHRERDGYGLNLNAVKKAASDGCRLLITVDCGSGSRVELEHAASLGMNTIVIDHHHVSSPDLPCDAFVSPKRPDCQHAYADYAAVGVTWQVLRHLTQSAWVDRYLPLVALGTVADVVPLTGANRAIVHHGLAAFEQYAGAGLRALAEASGLKPGRLTSQHFGFMLGPRINAAGRLDDPRPALELLRTDSPQRAAELAKYLSDLNRERQDLLEESVTEAQMFVESDGIADHPVLVVHSPGWRIGLVGLIASRLSDRYNRPVFALEQQSPLSRGSARSIDSFDVVNALDQCSDLLEEFGGHKMAAGLTIQTNRISEFIERINEVFVREVGAEVPLPGLTLDAELRSEMVSLDLVEELSRLEPCGQDNPAPAFLMRDVVIQNPRRSRDQAHLLFDVAGFHPLRAVSFGSGDRLVELTALKRADIAVSLRPNTWRGRTSVTLEVIDFRPPSPASQLS